MKKEKPIGMFDSGIGGLTVMREVMRLLPHEQILYLGDTARLPYGGKSRETIIRYSIENAIFLLEHQIKMLVIPCNTASSAALDKLRSIFNIPVIGVIEPGAHKAAQVTRNGKIAVLGTKGTIASGAYQKEIQRLLPEAMVVPIPCPLFVPLVEEKFIHHPAARLIVEEYLKPLAKQEVDTILLGCTHYPLLQKLIEEVVGPGIHIVDSATTCAEKVAEVLKEQNLQNHPHCPVHQFFVSDDPHKFQVHGEEILGSPIAHIRGV